jgi:hypothetical protein
MGLTLAGLPRYDVPAAFPEASDVSDQEAFALASGRAHPTSRGRASALAKLFQYFMQNGCCREPNSDRFVEGSSGYRKGWEVRIVVDTLRELEEVRSLLRRVGIEPPASYAKRRQFVQPIYGRAAFEKFFPLERSLP